MKHVYAVKDPIGGAIKIGTAQDVSKRLKALQTGCAGRLELLHAFRGGVAIEKALHYLLREHRLSGEWFTDHPEVRKLIWDAERGLLFHEDDWVAAARKAWENGMSYAAIGEATGYSREYVRQQIAPPRPPSVHKRKERVLPEPTNGIERAILIAGSEAALAYLIGVSQQAVNKMKVKGFAPLSRAEQIAAACNIPKRELLDPALLAALE